MSSVVAAWLNRVFPRVAPVDLGDKKALEHTYWRLMDELIPLAVTLHAHAIDFGTGPCNDLNNPEVERLAASAIESTEQVLGQLYSLRVRLIEILGYVPKA